GVVAREQLGFRYQVVTDSECGSAGLDEGAGSTECDSSGWDERNLWKRSLQCLDICGTAQIAAGEHFDKIRTGIPRPNNLCWRERAGHDEFAAAVCEFHHAGIENGTDQKFRTIVETLLRRSLIQYRAGADDHIIPHRRHELANHIDGIRNGHGDLK